MSGNRMQGAFFLSACMDGYAPIFTNTIREDS
jgi:hypothetical protein